MSLQFDTSSTVGDIVAADYRAAGVFDQFGLDFAVPSDGCTTYRVCYEELAAFDADLRQHIHLENNILFPHAVALEAALNES